MGIITERAFCTLLTLAKFVFPFFRNGKLLGLEFGAMMRPITERLIPAIATSAVKIIAWNQVHYRRFVDCGFFKNKIF